MVLKCIKSQKEAEFMVEGNSLCIEHVPPKIKEENWEIYKGSKTIIKPSKSQ